MLGQWVVAKMLNYRTRKSFCALLSSLLSSGTRLARFRARLLLRPQLEMPALRRPFFVGNSRPYPSRSLAIWPKESTTAVAHSDHSLGLWGELQMDYTSRRL